jgi:MSHA biogenesis protein MshL
MLMVRALPVEQRQINEYLKAARIQVERQVMIEAKIIEVSLNEGAQSGINWAYFNKGSSLSKGADSTQFVVPKIGTPPGTDLGELLGTGLPASSASNAGLFGLALQTTNFMALLNFLETQGGVQVLSSPRIAAINNQKAVLKVGTEEFFVSSITPGTAATTTSAAVSPSPQLSPFFSGIALDVTPQIDDQGHIILHVHPSVSLISEAKKTIDGIEYPLATSSVSETDSIVRLQDGEIAAIGGLMSRTSQDSKSAVPGMSKVPGLGWLFRNDATSRIKRELVILLKPTLIKQQTDWMDSVREVSARLESFTPQPEKPSAGAAK